VSVGGGHFSMGGTTASPGSLHLDMRRMNQILAFSPVERTIRVQAGVRWCDIQRFVDPHGLAVKIMQTYANFTVGGSLSVNCHGRYVGLGPLIMSVRRVKVVLADGTVAEASPTENSELFHGVVGCYGALGVIVEAELDLDENRRVERVDEKMAAADYPAHFRQKVRDTRQAIFHNADLYAPPLHHGAVGDVGGDQESGHHALPAAVAQARVSAGALFPLGGHRDEDRQVAPRAPHRPDPVSLRQGPLAQLRGRLRRGGAGAAVPKAPHLRAAGILRARGALRRVRPEDGGDLPAPPGERAERVGAPRLRRPGSLLAWARGETFAFVVYYKQRTRENAKQRVAVWTRELIDAALSVGGTYYLPTSRTARVEQFHRAYPRARSSSR
jgi:hypothetical protein